MSFIDELQKSFQNAKSQDDKYKILLELLNKKDIALKTELTKKQVLTVTRIKMLSIIHKDEFKANLITKILDNLLLEFRINQLSKDRKSRKETIDVLKSDSQTESRSAEFRKKFLGV